MIAAMLAALALTASETSPPASDAQEAPAPSVEPGAAPAIEGPAPSRPAARRVYATALSAGAFGARVYGLPVSGASLRAGPSISVPDETRVPFFSGVDLALVLDVGSTPEHLRVVHVEAQAIVWGRASILRLGVGLGVGYLDVERVTHRGGRLFTLLPSYRALVGVDVPLTRRLQGTVELHGAASVPYDGIGSVYPSFARISLVAGVRF